ncbi:MAG TPA: PaaI family thioesterase [Myxococcota bacterium]|nr:PaaI family thioesterase [Myxococcota bacterium]
MAPQIGETWRNDGPEHTCFGCGHANARGLRLVFTRTGERTVEAPFRAEAHWCGAPAVVHGGIQAALLDEVMGMAGHLAFDAEADGDVDIVTADFRLRYRRPVPVAAPLVLHGELQRVEGRDVFVGGEIRDAAGAVLTTGEARWRRLGR